MQEPWPREEPCALNFDFQSLNSLGRCKQLFLFFLLTRIEKHAMSLRRLPEGVRLNSVAARFEASHCKPSQDRLRDTNARSIALLAPPWCIQLGSNLDSDLSRMSPVIP